MVIPVHQSLICYTDGVFRGEHLDFLTGSNHLAYTVKTRGENAA